MYIVLRYPNHGEITAKFQLTGTGAEPKKNHKSRQFNIAQKLRVCGKSCLQLTETHPYISKGLNEIHNMQLIFQIYKQN